MVWVAETDVERYLSSGITTATTPTTAQVASFITEVEDSMLTQGLGTQTTASGTQFDVMPTRGMAKETVGWMLAGSPPVTTGRIVVPPFMPIVSVTSGMFQRNKNDLSAAPDWDTLKCKDNFPSASDTDFCILFAVNKKTNQRAGYALNFYDSLPTAGYRRLRGTWVYGHNIDSDILTEYATLKVCEKVIMARLFSAQPMNLATYAGEGMSSYVNTQFEVQMRWISERTEEIERLHFPKEMAIATLQGV